MPDAKTNHFVRLLKLWETGGLYLDFTTLLTKPFPVGKRFWSFGKACAADRDERNAEWAYAGSQEHYALAAPKARDPVLGCVLKKFDAAKDGLHACMAKGTAVVDGGAACLHKAFDECAAATKGGAPTLVRGSIFLFLRIGCVLRAWVATASHVDISQSTEGGPRTVAEL